MDSDSQTDSASMNVITLKPDQAHLYNMPFSEYSFHYTTYCFGLYQIVQKGRALYGQ